MKAKATDPEAPNWLNYMSMPRLKQKIYHSVEPRVFPDSVKATKQSYKEAKRQVKRNEEVFPAYNEIANLHSPLVLQLGVSNAIPDYDPDPYLAQSLAQVGKFGLKRTHRCKT